MRMINFDAPGRMWIGSYAKWQPCIRPRDARGRWARRENAVGPQTADANRGCKLIDWPPDRTVTVLQPNVDARIVRVKFVLIESSAKQLFLNLAERYGLRRYYHTRMSRHTVVLEGPEFNLSGLVVEYCKSYLKLYDFIRDAQRRFFDQKFGRDCHRFHW